MEAIPEGAMAEVARRVIEMLHVITEQDNLEELSLSVSKLMQAVFLKLIERGFTREEAITLLSVMAQRGK